MTKIEFNVQTITILKEGLDEPYPSIYFNCLPSIEGVYGMNEYKKIYKEKLDLLNEVMVNDRNLKNLKFYVEWDD